jgi:hypothetical protein
MRLRATVDVSAAGAGAIAEVRGKLCSRSLPLEALSQLCCWRQLWREARQSTARSARAAAAAIQQRLQYPANAHPCKQVKMR